MIAIEPTSGNTTLTVRSLHVPWVILLLGLTLPTLVTWCYFDLLSAAPAWVQKAAYGIGKGAQLALPLAAYAFWQKMDRRIDSDSLRSENTVGIVSGLVIGLGIVLIYFAWFLPVGAMELPRLEGRQKLDSLGLHTQFLLGCLAVFYSIVHSGFEELYWRGFVFRGLTSKLGQSAAVLISSLGFMSHHVLVLGRYFGWASNYTYLCSAGVAIGGAVWAIVYARFARIRAGWISHALVDAAIFAVAYHLVFADTR